MKKNINELTKEIIEVLNKKRGKKMKFKDDESSYDVYFADGITYECIIRSVYLVPGTVTDSVRVDVESLQGYQEWDAELSEVSSYGREAIAASLGISLERKPTMQESYDIICEHYERLKDSIRKYVAEHADENGILILEDNDDSSRPWVITTKEHDFAPDAYTECRCVALRVVDYDVQFYAVPSRLFRVQRKYTSSELMEFMWYTLDWDCANPFQYNIERIAYYLTNME